MNITNIQVKSSLLNEYAFGYFTRQKAIGFQTQRECLRVSAVKLLDDDGKKILKRLLVTVLIHQAVEIFFAHI